MYHSDMKTNSPAVTRRTIASLSLTAPVAAGLAVPAASSSDLTFSFATADFEVRNSGSVIADSNGSIELQMTPLAGSQKGGFFSKQALNLERSFVLDGEIYLGSEAANVAAGEDARGADGAAFTLFSQIPASLAGADGDGLGYSGLGTVFAVEWDTYHNGDNGDLGSEGLDLSMALAKNTADHTVSGALYAPVELIPRSTMIADNGTYRKFQIVWSSESERISVRYDLNSDGSFGAGETIFDAVQVDLIGA